jgi:hypothetical protein
MPFSLTAHMTGLTNSVNFTEIHQNLTDSVPLNFKIANFTVHRFKIFEK